MCTYIYIRFNVCDRFTVARDEVQAKVHAEQERARGVSNTTTEMNDEVHIYYVPSI